MTGPTKLWGGLIAVLLATAIWLTVRGSGGADQASTPTASPATSASVSNPSQATTGPTAVASSDAPGLERLKAQLNRRVKIFSRLYFARSPELTSRQIKQQVAPYASSQFLESATFGYGSSDADQSMRREGASLTVDKVSDLYGELSEDHTAASGVVILHVTKKDRNGQTVSSFNYQQTMTWLLQNGVWRIGSIDS
jgi:hypothetical protein